MHNTTTINISNNKQATNTVKKVLKLLFYIAIVLSIVIPIYYAINKPVDIPIDIPIDFATDIDWTKPPCNPDELSDDWNETTHPKMKNRREFVYKDTNIKIAFDKGIPGIYKHHTVDHWHRYNSNSANRHDRYLDKNGNPVRKGSEKSHIKPKCN